MMSSDVIAVFLKGWILFGEIWYNTLILIYVLNNNGPDLLYTRESAYEYASKKPTTD